MVAKKMKKTYSYSLAKVKESIKEKKCDYTYGFDPYLSNDYDLFKKYFTYKEQFYYDFIQKNLPTTLHILGIGSGLGVLEYYMKKNGFNTVTSSDLTIAYYPERFGVEYIKFNALEDAPLSGYDAVICFGLLYFFNDVELEKFFDNLSKVLPKNGVVIVDTSSSSDTWVAHFVNICLYLEMWGYRLYKLCVDKMWYHIKTIHAGYRRTDEEIITIAKKHGFLLVERENPVRVIDFERFMIYRKLVEKIPSVMYIANLLFGKRLCYFRMFMFRLNV